MGQQMTDAGGLHQSCVGVLLLRAARSNGGVMHRRYASTASLSEVNPIPDVRIPAPTQFDRPSAQIHTQTDPHGTSPAAAGAPDALAGTGSEPETLTHRTHTCK